jgi:flap endonuclease-1
MGVTNLIKVINKYAPDSISYKKITDYKGKTLGIDANLMIYKLVFAIRKNGYDIKNNGIKVTHLHSMLQKLIGFKNYNITPVFVFDGFYPTIKTNTIEKRKKFRKEMKKKFNQAVTQDEKKKYFYVKSSIKIDEIDQVKELINYFNYTIIDAKEEADSQLAYLSKKKIIDGIITDDLDILLFGGNLLLKNFTIDKKKNIQEINLTKLLKQSKLSHSQLIDIGILLGCDYCEDVKGVGPISSYKLIKEHKNMDNLLSKNIIKLEFNNKKAEDYFKNPPIKIINKTSIKKLNIDYSGLLKFLEKYGYNNDKLEKILNRLV